MWDSRGLGAESGAGAGPEIGVGSAATAAFCRAVARSRGPKTASLPSARSVVTSRRLLRVLPQIIEWRPQELLPIIPPIMARLLVEVSGANISPCGFSQALRSSLTTPG